MFRYTRFLRIGITPPRIFPRESEQIVRLLYSGIDYIHIRHPEETPGDVRHLIQSIPEEFHQRLTLHDYFESAVDLGIGGLHLNHRNPEIPDALARVRCRFRISRSCHSYDEIKDSAEMDYVTLSPIFDSISKQGYKTTFPQSKWDELKKVLRSLQIPVIALGGITEDKEEILKGLGFSGMAQLGSLWG